MTSTGQEDEALMEPSKEAVITGKREPYYLTYNRIIQNGKEEQKISRTEGEVRMNTRELDVLNVLYKTDMDMTVTDIIMHNNALTQSTVVAVCRKLLREGLIEVTGVAHSGKVLSRTYRPATAAKNKILEHLAYQYDSVCKAVTPEEVYEAIKARKGDKHGLKRRPKQDEVEKSQVSGEIDRELSDRMDMAAL